MPTGLGDELCWISPTISGDENDISGNGYDATLLNGASVVNQTGANGTKAISLDGANDYCQIDGDIFGTSVITNQHKGLSANFWVKYKSWNFNYHWLWGQRADGSYKKGYNILIRGDLHSTAPRTAHFAFQHYAPSDQRYYENFDLVDEEDWMHFSLNKNQGEIPSASSTKLYLNGNETTATSSGGSYPTTVNSFYSYAFTSHVRFGKVAYYYPSVYLDDFRFYNTSRTQEQVSLLSSARGATEGGTHVHRTLLGVG